MRPVQRDLDLPPPFRPVVLREAGDAFAHAVGKAGALGAGSLVFVGRFDAAEFAVVLEPEEPLAEARRSFYAGMTALADALAGLAPPETPIAIAWPDALKIGRRLVGGGRLAWPPATVEDTVPEWLVFGASIRLVSLRRSGAPAPLASTALADEGFGYIAAERLAEGFARHLMRAIDRWQQGDLAAVVDDYRARLDPAAASIPSGELRAALAAPSWLDPATGEIA